MLEVVFVGDRRASYPKILQNRIEINQTASMYDAQITLVTDNAYEAEEYLCKHSLDEFFVVLDIRVPHAFEFAQVARKQVKFMTIVVLDQDDKQLGKCVQLEIEPMTLWQEPVDNYKIQHTLDMAYQKYLRYFVKQDEKFLSCRDVEGILRQIKLEDISWIQVLTGKSRHVLLHKKNGHIFELHADLKSLERLSPKLFRISRSVLVNLQNVTHLDSKQRLVYMVNESVVLVISGRKLKRFTYELK